MTSTTDTKITDLNPPVKCPDVLTNTNTPKMMIHHKPLRTSPYIIIKSNVDLYVKPYGVSPDDRIITKGVMLKKFDSIRDCLEHTLGLSRAQRDVVLRLLLLWAYYGKVYPKESEISEAPICSKATFWRTIKLLRELGLVKVVNRYVMRPHAQISNLYLLRNLLIVIARWLAEHGYTSPAKWVSRYLRMSGQVFWSFRFVNMSASPHAPPG